MAKDLAGRIAVGFFEGRCCKKARLFNFLYGEEFDKTDVYRGSVINFTVMEGIGRLKLRNQALVYLG